ncbi:MAG: nuclear transport factor 2 family protein [Candidatus Blackburnbacteria bacterium]|nr:nuclear transport factor 2 family protein [Candidatus Blackburnbacteria bacterium]
MRKTEIVTIFLDAENRRNWKKWSSFVDSDIEYEPVGFAATRGKRAYVSRMKKAYKELKDWQFEIVNITENKNSVMVEFDGYGHFTGAEDEVQYTNVPLHLKAVCIFEVKNGKIIHIREYLDSQSYKKQLEVSNASGSVQ